MIAAAMAQDAMRPADLARIEAAIRYLELVQDTSVRAYHTAGRLFLLRIVVTLILLMIAGGVAGTPGTVDLFWFGVELKPWTVLVAGAVLASVMQFIDVPYYERGHHLAIRAVKLYDELGFPTPRNEWATRENPIRLPYAAAVTNDPLFGKPLSYDRASLGGQVLGWAFLLVTQLVVYAELRDQGHDSVWVYVFLLLPLMTAVLGALRYVLVFLAHVKDERELTVRT